MKAKELAEHLLKYPELDVWISDEAPIGEGGVRVRLVTAPLAVEADLDGDEIDDEYHYYDDMPYDLLHNSEYEYSSQMNAFSKRIFLIS